MSALGLEMAPLRKNRAGRRAAKRDRKPKPQSIAIALDKPRGPGIVAEIEEINQGSIGKLRRYKNIGEHPLTLAHYRGKLGGTGKDGDIMALRRWSAGETFRTMYELTISSGKDSTQPGVGGCSPTAKTTLPDAQISASLKLARIKQQMGSGKDYAICEAFCGMGHAMVDALRMAGVPFHTHAVLPRILEALDVLDAVLSRPLPPLRTYG